MQRKITPELLDSLPPEDPAARQSLRDLVRINRLMGSEDWLLRRLAGRGPAGGRALEIGAGTGRLARRLNAAGLVTDALDRRPPPPDWPCDLTWLRADLMQFDGYGAYRIVVANHVLHHFDEAELARLGRRLQAAEVIAACEPVRSRVCLCCFGLLAPLLGLSPVTRHDARVSIRAGFRKRDLPQALRLGPDHWQLHCSEGLFGTYRMLATRRKNELLTPGSGR
jgi:2-polyprenyl-3-methyl-5-hydroxy-6-metoxy-1,4-benzoquinol methylase